MHLINYFTIIVKTKQKQLFLSLVCSVVVCFLLYKGFELNKQVLYLNEKTFELKLNHKTKPYHDQCISLYKKLRYPNKSLFFNPPLKEIPPEMYADFTQNGLLPNRRYWYFNDRYPNPEGAKKNLVETISKEWVADLLNQVRTNQPLGYGDKMLNQKMTEYKSRIKGKSVAVIGTAWPWVEAIALNLEASNITTLDYTRYKYATPSMTWLHVNDYYDYAIENRLLEHIDNAASFSSIEHSGLGRFGDPLSPYGDVEAVKQVHCMLKPGGLFFLGLPCTRDNSSFLEFNAYRVYGTTRLNLLFEGWKLLEQVYETGGFQKIFVLEKI